MYKVETYEMKPEEVPECWLFIPYSLSKGDVDEEPSREDIIMCWFEEYLQEREDLLLCPR
jgi:hypothetical protein